MGVGEILNSREAGLIVNVVALLFSLGMLASLLPGVHIPALVQIAYYLIVPGYGLLRLVDHPFGRIDEMALVVAISLGLLVGFVALFQTFYPTGRFNQSLVIPVIAVIALAISLRPASRVKTQSP